jgi:hypothetical protein
VNLYAFRATDPRELRKVADPIGPRNDVAVGAATLGARFVVAAWGAHASENRQHWALARGISPIRDVHHLGLTVKGFPRHPLYVAGLTRPTLWQAGRKA